MVSKILNINYDICQEKELSIKDKKIIQLAKEATNRSFSPYSNFSVGAAIELDNGTIILGSNQENASYTTGICAERCAMFYANSQYPNIAINSIAIAAKNSSNQFTPNPITPCGACRQVLSEVEARFHPIRLLLYGANHIYIFNSLKDILPFQFNSSSL